MIFMDLSGNAIAKHSNGKTDLDATSFAALAAGNFAAVDALARLVGESEFSLLFHKRGKIKHSLQQSHRRHPFNFNVW